MKIAIVGTGYVGLVSGACFAEMGTDVTCVDIDKAKIESLRQGIIPIYEPGLDELVRRNVRDGRLHFTTSLEEVINDVEAVFSAVGTPPDDDGSADLTAVKAVARTFGRHIDRQAILVTKSTVPVGTSEIIRGIINEELDRRGVNVDFELASNPEFLKEGAAIKDFMSPDRVVIGVDGPRSREVMERLYRPFLLQNFRVMFMDIPSAEMAKYAANAMLATRISFINDIANLCELTGADVSQVRRAIGADTRIGNKFLYPGCGYGGSCFPKDVQALIRTGEQLGYPMRVIQAVEAVNDEQKHIPFRKLRKALGRLEGRRIALWGLAFKPETDDMRLAPSLTLIEDLLGDGATVCVFDPVAMDECRRRLSDKVDYATDMYAACIDADALCVLTEWKQFRLPSWPAVARLMNGETVIDGRNIYSPDDLAAAGLKVHAIGRPDHAATAPADTAAHDTTHYSSNMKVIQFLKDWTLIIAILAGIGGYFAYVSIPWLRPTHILASEAIAVVQPLLIFSMLFITFSKINPHELRLRRWHLWLLLLQCGLFTAIGLVLIAMPHSGIRIVLEGAMICLICPTATAGAVITRKLGGDVNNITTYTILINLAAALMIPALVPFVHPNPEMSAMTSSMLILRKVFPLLLMPLVAALAIRRMLPGLNRRIGSLQGLTFYLWAVALALATAVTTRSIVHHRVDVATQLWLVAVSLICCAMQFWIGRKIGLRYNDMITAGQSFGQKNTVLAIWMGYTFFTPITAVAGGFYSIWHNLVNSYQLYEHKKSTAENTAAKAGS